MRAKPHHREVDRRRAIALGLELARPRDTMLLAGKGHETYQVVGTEKLPFDERVVVGELGASWGTKCGPPHADGGAGVRGREESATAEEGRSCGRPLQPLVPHDARRALTTTRSSGVS